MMANGIESQKSRNHNRANAGRVNAERWASEGQTAMEMVILY